MEYFLTFLEGIASFISPCIIPMLPIYISYFAGKDDKEKCQTIKNAVGFVIGFTLIFVILAIFASSFGKLIGQYSNYIKYLFGIIIILLGINYIGIFKITFLNRTSKIKMDLKKLDFVKSVALGMLFSISWTPCMGSFLSSALLLVAKEQYLVKGIVLILLYSIGLGIPFIASVVLIDKLKSTFDFIKRHYDIITKISGAILIIMGVYLIMN